MKKTLAKGLALAFIGSLFVAGSAMAVPSLYFTGEYTLSNADSDDYLEYLEFGTAYINSFDPLTDSLFGADYYDNTMGPDVYGTVMFAKLTLDELDNYQFNPTFYEDGFKIYDVDSSGNQHLILTADLEFTELEIINTVANINSNFNMNLTNMHTTDIYSNGLNSTIIDALMAAPGGATNINFTATGDLATLIKNESSKDVVEGTYSGSAAPAPVPEPATMLLFGTGLAGLATLRMRKANK